VIVLVSGFKFQVEKLVEQSKLLQNKNPIFEKRNFDMNRLVIVGNGFDLAHGLPTSYRDFIDEFWTNLKSEHKNSHYQNLVLTNDSYNRFYLEYKTINNYQDFKSNLFEYCKEHNYQFSDKNCVARNSFQDIFHFKNDFFLKINNESIENWVDIENLYYIELKKIVNSKSLDVTKTAEFWRTEQLNSVKKLNEEFEDVKRLFEKYLLEKVESIYRYQVNEDVLSFFSILCRELNQNSSEDDYLKEFSKNDINHLVEIDNLICTSLNRRDDVNSGKIPIQNVFLNFNYTKTLDEYVELLNNKRPEENSFLYGNTIQIQIHGRLNSNSNQINFGFGDEMDEDYKLIENINDNEYLKNFKSFEYLQNSNYKDLLDFIDSEKFQVFIMGHSCGLSDRTLLNTIFEHTHCRSIKIFYHQKENSKDNYTEIIQNISRHFNKKKLMREKIVNKTLCQPLPQIQLPKKQ
jgi:hypothetical protein